MSDNDGIEDTNEEAPFEWTVTDELDLHTFAPSEAAAVTEAWLDECARLGMKQLRLVHGKGRGALRRTVQKVLARHPAVLSYDTADATRGGWGATLVTLKEG